MTIFTVKIYCTNSCGVVLATLNFHRGIIRNAACLFLHVCVFEAGVLRLWKSAGFYWLSLWRDSPKQQASTVLTWKLIQEDVFMVLGGFNILIQKKGKKIFNTFQSIILLNKPYSSEFFLFCLTCIRWSKYAINIKILQIYKLKNNLFS